MICIDTIANYPYVVWFTGGMHGGTCIDSNANYPYVVWFAGGMHGGTCIDSKSNYPYVVWFTGGMYGGANIIKSRLLPWLGQNFFTSGGSVTADTTLSVLADAASKDRELGELQVMYEKSLDELEAELNTTKAENQDLRVE